MDNDSITLKASIMFLTSVNIWFPWHQRNPSKLVFIWYWWSYSKPQAGIHQTHNHWHSIHIIKFILLLLHALAVKNTELSWTMMAELDKIITVNFYCFVLFEGVIALLVQMWNHKFSIFVICLSSCMHMQSTYKGKKKSGGGGEGKDSTQVHYFLPDCKSPIEYWLQYMFSVYINMYFKN